MQPIQGIRVFVGSTTLTTDSRGKYAATQVPRGTLQIVRVDSSYVSPSGKRFNFNPDRYSISANNDVNVVPDFKGVPR
jgi:hypothetical protein